MSRELHRTLVVGAESKTMIGGKEVKFDSDYLACEVSNEMAPFHRKATTKIAAIRMLDLLCPSGAHGPAGVGNRPTRAPALAAASA